MAPGRDTISQFPVDILDHILGLLPIKNAARAAVLSSVWRGGWSSLTQLNFDDHFFCHNIDRKYHLKYHRVKKCNKLGICPKFACDQQSSPAAQRDYSEINSQLF